jgi:hypothetical protein
MSLGINRESFILIRVYGDSLGMPREFDAIPFYCTYTEILKQKLELIRSGKQICLYNRSNGGWSIKSLWAHYQSDSTYFRPGKGDVLIIQCGIVDCAPRPVPSFLRRIISLLPKRINYAVAELLHNYRPNILRSGFSWRHCMPQEFKSILIKWLTTAKEDFDRVYVVNIAPTNEAIEAHSPGLTSSIKLFNKLIFKSIKSVAAKNVYLMDVHEAISHSASGISMFINEKDGHHITLEGHKLYAQMIATNEAEHAKEWRRI